MPCGHTSLLQRHEVLIIGGGIGGLTAAIACGRLGIDAHVYERAPVLREVGAGIALSAAAVGVLDTLGLGSAVREQCSERLQGGLKNARGDTLFAISQDQFSRQLGSVAVLHRAELLSMLTREIDPARIHLGCECVGFAQNGEGVTARFANGESAQGDVLIGADGLKSAIRAALLGDLRPRYAGYTAWRAVVDWDGVRTLDIVETWGCGRRFGMVPMSRGRIYWFATHNTPEGQRDPPGESREILSRLFRGWHDPIEALIAAAPESAILRNDIYDLDPLSQWVRDRVALLGDAAHPMTPNLGQGACQAIEDAAVLAACLHAHDNVAPALLEYQRRRVPRASQFVKRSRSLGIVAQCENPLLCWVRDTATRLTPQWVATRQLRSTLGGEILTPAESRLFAGR